MAEDRQRGTTHPTRYLVGEAIEEAPRFGSRQCVAASAKAYDYFAIRSEWTGHVVG